MRINLKYINLAPLAPELINVYAFSEYLSILNI